MSATMKHVLQFLSLSVLLSPCFSAPSNPNAPVVVHPIRNQRPPVARVDIPFSWSLLAGTFNTSTGTAGMSLRVEKLPSWATFIPETQTITGTPTASDLGFTTVTFTASNAGNPSSVSDDLRLLVAKGHAPTVKLPLATQLGNGSVLGSAKYDHATQGISVPPNWSWSVGLLPDTFVADHKTGIYYTAYEVGTTSLPNWIKFNAKTATFDGVSPSEQKDTFIVVYGSDYFGYGDVQQTFRLTVSAHLLDLLAPLPALNATAQSIVNYTIPFDSFTIDGAPTNSSTKVEVKVDLSQAPYLTYDETTSSISGTLPESLAPFTNMTIPITFSTSSCHNVVSTELFLRVVPGLFTAPILPPFHIHPNENFTINLVQYTSNLNATYSLASITPENFASWLHFSNQPLAIMGQAPSTLDSKSQQIVIDLEASGLNNLKSSAQLPVVFVAQSKEQSRHSHSGLPGRAKLWLAIIFGTIGGIILLILIMRTCRTYCSADGQRESVQDIYYPYYSKNDEAKFLGSSMKGTPYSAGETLVDPRSPAWNAKAGLGGPMMAITQTELAITQDQPFPQSGFKRLAALNVFKKAHIVNRTSIPTRVTSLQGLGIVEPNHQVVHLDVQSESKPTDEADLGGWRAASEDSESRVADVGLNPPSSSGSSWNTTSSSSLFYSDTTRDDSELSSSSRSGAGSRWLETPTGSTPRRRKDFVPRATPGTQHSASSSILSADIDVGTIRMVTNASASLDVAKTSSESLGAIKTASYRRITADYSSASGNGSSEANSGAHRPMLIPLQGKQVSQDQASPFPSVSEDSSAATNEVGTFDHTRLESPARNHRLSVQSDAYRFEPSASKPGSPATSAIFFSSGSTDHPGVHTSFSQPTRVSKAYFNGPKSSVRAHSPLHESHSADSFATNLRGSASFGLDGSSSIFSVGVGEPFHMTPSMKLPSSNANFQSSSSLVLNKNHHYHALIDCPGQPELDRKQLPDWLHFDAKECEIWGIPRKIDAGSISIQIIESKPFTRPLRTGAETSISFDSTSPGNQRETEEVVARFTLNVIDKTSFKGSRHGDLATVTF